MTEADVLQRVLRFLSEKFPEYADDLSPSSPLQETVLLDSLATLEVVVFLEQDFGLRVERSDLDRFRTPQGIADLIMSKQRPA